MKKTLLVLFVFALALAAGCAAPATLPSPATPSPAILNTPVAPTPAPSPMPPLPAASGPISVTILHTNDMHGYLEGEKLKGGDGNTFEFGGIANAFGTIARLRQEAGGNTIVLDGGDFYMGTFASNRDNGKGIVAAMNAIGYDALAAGNHDFDHGQDVLQARAGEAKFPFLAANLVETSTGKSPAWLKPYLIKQVAGIRFGIIGTTYPDTPAIQKASSIKGLKFLPDAQAVAEILPEVKSKSDIIIVLAHQGIDYIDRLATIPGVDIVVSAHSHTELRQPRLFGSTIVVQAGSKAQYVGKLDLSVDPATKKIVGYTKNNELVSAVSNKATTPKEITDIVSKLVSDAREAMSRPIGETEIDLKIGRLTDGRSSGEYPLANLIADAMLAANQAGDRPADVAWHNQGGIRADLAKGPITYGALYQVLPMDNVLTAMDLPGATLKEALETATSCPRTNSVVAGMSFTYDCAKPQGQRISNIVIQGKPFDLQKIYRVQTIDYLAGGGDGLAAFTKGTNLAYGDPVVDVVADYVTKHSPLNLKTEGRIVAAP